jgi:hypothetical protein
MCSYLYKLRHRTKMKPYLDRSQFCMVCYTVCRVIYSLCLTFSEQRHIHGAGRHCSTGSGRTSGFRLHWDGKHNHHGRRREDVRTSNIGIICQLWPDRKACGTSPSGSGRFPLPGYHRSHIVCDSGPRSSLRSALGVGHEASVALGSSRGEGPHVQAARGPRCR